jgi:hypothetical protein
MPVMNAKHVHRGDAQTALPGVDAPMEATAGVVSAAFAHRPDG